MGIPWCEKCGEKKASWKVKGKRQSLVRCEDCREKSMIRGIPKEQPCLQK